MFCIFCHRFEHMQKMLRFIDNSMVSRNSSFFQNPPTFSQVFLANDWKTSLTNRKHAKAVISLLSLLG